MHAFSLALLALAMTVPATAALEYEIPPELLALAPPLDADTASASVGHQSAASVASAASCIYPARFALADFQTWTPAGQNTSSVSSYVSFTYTDRSTALTTACTRNASSVLLTAGTSLADRYACDNALVAFIWQHGKLTLIETACPGMTLTKYEASGSVRPAGLQCTNTTACAATATACTNTSSSSPPGTLCRAPGLLAANFTSLQPSPLQSTSTSQRRMRRVRRSINLF